MVVDTNENGKDFEEQEDRLTHISKKGGLKLVNIPKVVQPKLFRESIS